MKYLDALKEVWVRSDSFFQFRFTEYTTLGSRLQKWREINNISKMSIANLIYDYRVYLGLENHDISKETLNNNQSVYPEDKQIDYDTVSKINQKKERRITSIMRTYSRWESKTCDTFATNTPFSMVNLYILKNILQCDYEFLFCEINTPHKHTNEISNQIGLNISSIEKLTNLKNLQLQEGCYSPYYYILSTLNMLISDTDLMTYLSWYLVNESSLDKETDPSFSSISINMPSENTPYILDSEDIHTVFLTTISNKLNTLRNIKPETISKSISTTDYNNSSNETQECDSFGKRLKNWRKDRYTQNEVADLILSFRKENNLEKNSDASDYILEKDSILRTYQNWETNNKADVRISMTDLYTLKSIMDCDYEYLFGEIRTLKKPTTTLNEEIGLSYNNYVKLKSYTESSNDYSIAPVYADDILKSIDLIVSEDDLLSYLTYYLTDIPYYANSKMCNILKPIPIYGNYPKGDPFHYVFLKADAYNHYLFPENNEMRNAFIIGIFNSLKALRERNCYNNQPINDYLNSLF